MTLPTTSSRVDYLGDGSSTAFAVPYRFFDTSELRVIERMIATGEETVLALGAQYSVTGGNGATGTVTALAPPAATKQWTILRATRRTQEVDLQPNDPLPAETLERVLDRAVALIQENERDQARAVRVPETDPTGSLTLPTSAARASHVLGFDTSGNPIPVVPSTENLPVTDYTVELLQAADAEAARATLGAGATGDDLFTAATPAIARDTLGAGATGGDLFQATTPASARGSLEMDTIDVEITADTPVVSVDLPPAWLLAEILMSGITVSAAAFIQAQVRRTGQVAFDTANYVTQYYGRTLANAADTITSAALVPAQAIQLGTAIDPSPTCETLIQGLLSLDGPTPPSYHGTSWTSAPSPGFETLVTLGARCPTAGHLDRLAFFPSGGANFTAGRIRLTRRM